MAYAAGTIKVVFSGTLPQGQSFAFGYCLDSGSGTPSDQATAAANWSQVAIQSEDASPILHTMTTGTKITQVRAYHYGGGTAADAIEGNSFEQDGLSNNAQLPAQCALVLSLRTASTLRSGRGRIFLPCNGSGLQGGQQISPTVTALANSIKAIFGYLSNTSGTGGPFRPVVASAKHGVNREITNIIVDSRLDVIRHRAQGETPTSIANVAL